MRRGAECPAITNNATVDECKPLTKNRMSLEHTDRKINDSVILSAKEVWIMMILEKLASEKLAGMSVLFNSGVKVIYSQYM